MRRLETSAALAALLLATSGPAFAGSQLQAWVTTGDKSQLMAAQPPSGVVSADAVAGLPTITVDARDCGSPTK